ncbi:MAG: hypothetical protein ABSB86_04070 [Bryobacteraceae bacterium]
MNNPLFLLYGVFLLGLTGVAEYRGWSLSSVNQQKVLPKSIRDNPGAYRSTYGGVSRYIGGK